jgi:hypothetical protein
MTTSWISEEERRQYQADLAELVIEHRDLDTAIRAMEMRADHDQLQVRRMKKRKLLLKDEMAWIERQLDPDVPA